MKKFLLYLGLFLGWVVLATAGFLVFDVLGAMIMTFGYIIILNALDLG